MKKPNKAKLYITSMISEATRPIGTEFTHIIEGKEVKVSRIRHIIDLHKALLKVFKLV